ncbi:tetratricopeptide repeat protein [Candidatus Magnetominusculus dajiuhuensis]|uniref:tetratricopeptide repeat protein n=1 Tax=Candidatus Magnetominusculus dajiuhuensis TaxID=3137712 RepID=UPI003B42B756
MSEPLTRLSKSPLQTKIIICLLLIAAVFTVYAQVKDFKFLFYDDNQYILENLHVRGGPSLRNLQWAVTSAEYSNWFPVTWASHMVDVWLFGLWPGGHHLTNVAFHAGNAVLLFLLFSSVTGALWRSVLIAALFAFHPLHVESVAWVAERKDVLSAFFWISAMCAYVFYARRASLGRYMAVICCFVLGLMSKPVVVALPLVLLLLDYWPLGRFSDGKAPAVSLFTEKIPFIILSALTGFVTYYVQKTGGAVAPLSALTLKLRMENVAVSYVKYIIKLFYPTGLGIMYRHPAEYPAWQVVGAIIVLVAVSIFAIAAMRRRPWFFTGWFWYILTLMPTIGAVKVGISYMADRYTYMPYVGLFIILSMAVPTGAYSAGVIRRIAANTAAAAVVICIILTNHQLKYWRNSVTLFTRAAAVTTDSYFAYYSLGYALNIEGRFGEAESALKVAVLIKPDYAEALLHLGMLELRREKLNEAHEVFIKAIMARPTMPEAYNGAGVALMNMGRLNEATAYFRRALALDSGNEDAARNLKLIADSANGQ